MGSKEISALKIITDMLVNLNVEAVLKLLLSFNANANIPNNYGKFPIHTAVENNFLDIVKILVENGADVDALNQVTGKTPTHSAVERNLEEMVNFLVKDAQADVTRLDFSDMSPSDLAEFCKSNTIKRLLSKEMKKQT